jgi:hypothetical protein
MRGVKIDDPFDKLSSIALDSVGTDRLTADKIALSGQIRGFTPCLIGGNFCSVLDFTLQADGDIFVAHFNTGFLNCRISNPQ